MKKAPTLFLQGFIALVGIAVLALLLREPWMEGVNANATTLSQIYFDDPFLLLAYVGAIPFFVALYQAIKILGFVRNNQAFSVATVKGLRTIKYCAFTIIGFVVAEELFVLVTNNLDKDNPGAPLFMGLVITLGSLVVTAATTMFEQIVQSKM